MKGDERKTLEAGGPESSRGDAGGRPVDSLTPLQPPGSPDQIHRSGEGRGSHATLSRSSEQPITYFEHCPACGGRTEDCGGLWVCLDCTWCHPKLEGGLGI